ncbi:caspase family protein [Methylomonas rivi]|uniref:Caspase family protein n=1 Tax=Methylomonas rivi TaxID=2952226 RepID=A0ABT1U931_9GAMM|nr:caspase family protein [Methylomonas sp. WSC-6]MCQ8130363.1 caspase family protein [Methylomonas sp. WSC-6]
MRQDLSLVLDNRAANNKPGMHALVIGISAYSHLPKASDGIGDPVFKMGGLASPALTAWKIGEWLRDPNTLLEYPLKTLRLLTSPDPQEIISGHPDAQSNPPSPATRDNIQYALRRWRDDARQEPNGCTFFYFGGHGLRADNNDAIILAEDFLEPDWTNLDRTLKFLDVINGMAPNASQAKISKVQFYFLDCCRNKPADKNLTDLDLARVRGTFLESGDGPDLRTRMAYFATVDGGTAISRAGNLTYFGDMLLEAVTTGASNGLEPGQPHPRGKTRFPVTGPSLTQFFERRRKQRGLDPIEAAAIYGRSGKLEILCWLQTPPLIDITFVIADPELREDALVTLKSDSGLIIQVQQPVQNGQNLFKDLPMGRYEILVRSISNVVDPLTFGVQYITPNSPDPWLLSLDMAMPYLSGGVT